MHYNTAEANSKEHRDMRRELRSNATPAEAALWRALWRALKGHGAGGYKFRRQQGIGPYILDFYCPELRLCVELDGASHDYKYEYDEQRTEYLRRQGIRVVRFENRLVWTSIDRIVEQIVQIGEEMKGLR